MTSISPHEQADSTSTTIETDLRLPEHETALPGPEGRYLAPNRISVRELEAVPGCQKCASADVATTADVGLEGYHNGTAASEVEPGRFEDTRLLTPSEVRQRAYEALNRAELRRKVLREQDASSAENAYQY